MNTLHKVGVRGQLVIEKSIRDALGIEPGSVAFQQLVGDHLEIHFYPPEHERSLRGILAEKRKHSLKVQEWEPARQRAWADASASEWRKRRHD